jgi:hypothetical protein
MRVWTWFSFVSLWWSQNYGAGSWSTGAALINAGLTFNQALGVSALGCILTSLVGVAAAVSQSAQSRLIPWLSLIDAAGGCSIPYRFSSLVQKYVRNVGIKDHGRVQGSHRDHLVCCTNVSHDAITSCSETSMTAERDPASTLLSCCRSRLEPSLEGLGLI